jgi:hypothetical protein
VLTVFESLGSTIDAIQHVQAEVHHGCHPSRTGTTHHLYCVEKAVVTCSNVLNVFGYIFRLLLEYSSKNKR